MIRIYAEIFCWKNVSSFCIAKATHIFSAKNIILYIESAKTVNEMTLNELVKLTTLWTTGPRFIRCVLYRIYPKYSDASTPYHICYKIWTSTIYYLLLCLKIAGRVANRVDPDETPRSAASHLGLHCLLRPVCPKPYDKYGNCGVSWVSLNINSLLRNPHLNAPQQFALWMLHYLRLQS